jgi:oxygen-independent coproporphyrinogen-3 oxidase
VFFGGGTPTLMKPKTLAAILEAVGRAWTLAPNVEITVEANPSSAEIALFRDFRAAGVNRLSLGVQSFDPAALAFLGRRHDADQARRAIAESQAVFPRTSFDLIYARPDQTEAGWHRELDEALSRTGEHLSVYQLTIEPGTEFRRRRIEPAEDELAATLYEITQERLTAAGLPAYEVSNHARPGAECRHNLVYWRGEDYAGIGPGAHGRLTHGDCVEAVEEIRAPGAWLAAVRERGSGTRTRTPLNAGERFEERVLMGLRLREGIPETLASTLGHARVEALVGEGYLARDAERLRATPAGMQRLNAVISYLIS